MPYTRTSCQLPHPRTGDSSQISTHTDDTPCPHTSRDTRPETPTLETVFDYSGGAGNLVRGAAQELEHTQSRRSGPRRWLRAVTWLIAAGLHPRAGATTLRVAEDLKTRMNYDTGHAIYDLDGTAARLGVHRATVKRHVKYLRELGALVWASHGSQHNSRAARGLQGYAGTATIYAAVIPPVYDHAMGHTIIGTGYTARIVIDQRAQAPAQKQAEPVDNSGAGQGRAPLSLTWVTEDGQVQVVGGSTTTEQARAAKNTKPARPKKRTILGRKVTAAASQRARRFARWVRPLVNWLQSASHDELSWVLVDPTLDGWDDQQILAWLSAMGRITHDGHTWRPAKPHRVIAAQLRAEQRQLVPQAMEADEWAVYHQLRAAEAQTREEQQAAAMAERTNAERVDAQAAGRYDLRQVVDHLLEYGEVDTIDLYGVDLAIKADHFNRSPHIRMGV